MKNLKIKLFFFFSFTVLLLGQVPHFASASLVYTFDESYGGYPAATAPMSTNLQVCRIGEILRIASGNTSAFTGPNLRASEITDITTGVDGQYRWLVGTDSSDCDETNYTTYDYGDVWVVGGIAYDYFVPPLSDTSGISFFIDTISPVTSPTASTNVNFKWTGYNTGQEGYDKIGVEIRNVTAGITVVPTLQDSAFTGTVTYDQDYTLTTGQGYLWRPFFTNTASSTVPNKNGEWVGMIDIVTTSASTSCGSLCGDSESSSFLFAFLDVPTLLKTKVPFSYVYEFSGIIGGYSEITASDVSEITVSFSGSTTPPALSATFDDITLFSTSTVTHFLSPTLLALMKLLLSMTIWVGAGFHVYSMIIKTTMKDIN